MAGDIVGRIIESARIALETSVPSAFDRWSTFCESPIEAALLTAITLEAAIDEWVVDRLILRVARTPDEPTPPCFLKLVPQYQWNDCRVDFAYFISGKPEPCLFIECDGHNFHERTPEQAERDRRRDRLMQEAGIPVLRFTGREIYRDPSGCAFQISRFIVERCLP
jgi:very-short-patch-repair endonuclease